MSISHQIKNVAAQLAQLEADNQKLATPFLARKAERALENYPHDQTLISISKVLDKMVDNNQMFIRQAEFKQLGQKLSSTYSVFSQLFQNELGIKISEEAEVEKEVMSAKVPEYQITDPVLAGLLISAVDKTAKFVPYSAGHAKEACNGVKYALDCANLYPTKVSATNGNNKFIVVKADYETPKGIASFYVPVEIVENIVKDPLVFVSNAGTKDLDYNNIRGYLLSKDAYRLTVNGHQILQALTSATEAKREVSDAEIAVSRMYGSKYAQQQASIQLPAIEAPVVDVATPQFEEAQTFSQELATASGAASMYFGNDKIKLAKELVIRELSFSGHKSQVKVASYNKNSVTFGVTLDGKISFLVPVKISKQISQPTVMICNGSISSFDSKSIDNLFLSNKTDLQITAQNSNFSTMHDSNLVQEVEAAMLEGNQAKAEDVLNVLARRDNPTLYHKAMQIFMNGLSGKLVRAESKCDRILKTANSQHMICGHTNLPVHKVYQDKHGDCRPLYNKSVEDQELVAPSITHKAFGY